MPVMEVIELGYEVIKGQEFFDQRIPKIDLLSTDHHCYSFDLHLKRPSGFEYPMVKERRFGKTEWEPADEFHYTLKVKSERTRKTIIDDEFDDSSPVKIFPSHLKSISPGLDTLVFKVKGWYESFGGTPSNEHKISFEIRVGVEVRPIYKTLLHFTYMRLNEDKSMEILGTNDFGNSRPETMFRVDYFDQWIISTSTKNNFTLEKDREFEIYHTFFDKIKISALDEDGMFNFNDLISDTFMYMRHLELDDSAFIRFGAVDELRLTTVPRVQVN